MSDIIDPGDIAIVQGNNYPPAVWQFLSSENPDVLFPIAGSRFKLNITWPGGSLVRASDVNPELAIDTANSILTWNYSAAQSRSLPLGRLSRYEIEMWSGTIQQSVIAAYMIVDSGANPD